MIAAIDLGGTRTKFGLVDQGKVICASNCSADAQGSLDGHLNEVLERLRALGAEQETTLEACQGMGVLSTGVVNNREMRVLSTNAKYDDAVGFDFRGWARDRTGLELRMDNDARGALIGEWRYGAGRGADNLVMITIGTGIGTAVIVEGRPLTGPHFTAGNLGGHIVVRSGGRKCTCGGVGCLESEASGWVLPELVREHALYGESSLNELDTIGFREVMAHAAAGDACAGAVRQHCLTAVGRGIGVVYSSIRPRADHRRWRSDERSGARVGESPQDRGGTGLGGRGAGGDRESGTSGQRRTDRRVGAVLLGTRRRKGVRSLFWLSDPLDGAFGVGRGDARSTPGPTCGPSIRPTPRPPREILFAQRRTASNSLSDSGWLTRSTQCGHRGIGQGDNSLGAGSGSCSQRHSDPQRQSSARLTNPARNAFRST